MRRAGHFTFQWRRPKLTALHDQVSRAFLDWREDVYRYLLTLGLSAPEAQDATQKCSSACM